MGQRNAKRFWRPGWRTVLALGVIVLAGSAIGQDTPPPGSAGDQSGVQNTSAAPGETPDANNASAPQLTPPASDDHPLWFWPIVLFLTSFAIGVVAVMGGVGGAVLFVPLVSGFMPFHIDYVRCAGLLVALAGSVSAAPSLLRRQLASIRLALPMALIASASAIIGARLGLALPDWAVQIAMGIMILGVTAVMLLAKRTDYPQVPKPDALGQVLGIYGLYHEPTRGEQVDWKVHRTATGMALFVLVGLMGGVFGVGAGWANVQVFNLLLGVPLKVSVATSNFLIATASTTASWVYINQGAALPMIVVPSMAGMMLGTRISAALLSRAKPKGVRILVLALLMFAGGRAILKGLQIMGVLG